MTLADRRGADKFKAAFQRCFSNETLTLRTVRGCARKARQFQLAYVAAAAVSSGALQLDGPISAEDIAKCVDRVSYDRIEQMRKEVKTHRSVADINGIEIRFILAEETARTS
jgi:hypothetical protein